MSHQGCEDHKGPLDRRLARIEGQVRGLRRMVSEGEYCLDILTQVAAVRAALDRVGAQIVTNHVNHCVLMPNSEGAHPHAKAQSEAERLKELEAILVRLVK